MRVKRGPVLISRVVFGILPPASWLVVVLMVLMVMMALDVAVVLDLRGRSGGHRLLVVEVVRGSGPWLSW